MNCLPFSLGWLRCPPAPTFLRKPSEQEKEPSVAPLRQTAASAEDMKDVVEGCFLQDEVLSIGLLIILQMSHGPS